MTTERLTPLLGGDTPYLMAPLMFLSLTIG